MDQEKIVSFVKDNIEPLPAVAPYGFRYRVSATLSDGTFLPCVVVESTRHTVELAMRRFDEEKKGGIRAILNQSGGYPKIVESFGEGCRVRPERMKDGGGIETGIKE